MKISKIKIVGLFFLVSCFLISCSSLPDASEENQTLVVGQIILEAKGFLTYGSVSVNGINRNGIEITIQEVSTGKEYKMKSFIRGIFHSVKIPEGSYRITSYYFKKSVGNSWADVRQNNPGYKFEIVNGKVNNMGLIQWNSERGKQTVSLYNSQYDQVRSEFQKEFEKSNWNEREWINIDLLR